MPDLMTYRFMLRPDFEAVLVLPVDLTEAEVERIHRFVSSLVLIKETTR